ncbi:hypothetical protein FNF27_04710 [Cafeteria roenbergensis]|uniref:DNA-directed RNA polymerase III subunit RPC3 n=1 Tax=Cafeteria roenbergensis TaxID=33653 RepID=A0A5A8E7S6_CAFRO|nr:hypothetical protein FNF27_04710 [Cafeteria roenbergensis]
MERVELAYDIAADEFGPLCGAVCRQLVHQGPQTLAQLVRALVHAGDPLRAPRKGAAPRPGGPVDPPSIPDEFLASVSSAAYRLVTKAPELPAPFMTAAELQSALTSLLLAGIVSSTVRARPFDPAAAPKAEGANKAAQRGRRAAVAASGERIAASASSIGTAYLPPTYAFEPGRAIERLRFPRAIQFLATHFGAAGVLVGEQLCHHAVRSKEDVLEAAREREEALELVREGAATAEQEGAAALVSGAAVGSEFDSARVPGVWDELVSAGFVVRASGHALPTEWLGGTDGALLVRPPAPVNPLVDADGDVLGGSGEIARAAAAAAEIWGADDAGGSDDDQSGAAGGPVPKRGRASKASSAARGPGGSKGLGVGLSVGGSTLARQLRPPGNARRVGSDTVLRAERRRGKRGRESEPAEGSAKQARQAAATRGPGASGRQSGAAAANGGEDDGNDDDDEGDDDDDETAGAGARRRHRRAAIRDDDDDDDDNNDDDDDADEDDEGETPAPTPLWRLNLDAVNARIRDAAVARYVTQRISTLAGTVIGAALDLAFVAGDPQALAGLNAVVSARDVAAHARMAHAAALRAAEAIPGEEGSILPATLCASASAMRAGRKGIPATPPDWAAVISNLEVLGSRELGFVTRTRAGADGGEHQVSLERLTRLVRRRSLESFVDRKYGPVAARIVRLLVARGMLEDRAVGDVAMLPLKDARSLLFRLYAAGVVSLRQVAKRTDFAPASIIFLWFVDDDTLAEQARLGVVSAIHRLRVRRRAELRKLDEVKAARERSACGDGAAAAFADKEGAILLGIDRLDAASVHVEDTLAALQRWAADGEGRMATVLAGDDDDEPSG